MDNQAPNTEDQAQQESMYEDYRNQRAENLQFRSVAVQMLDKTLLTVNTGTFLISFTYIFQLAAKSTVRHIELMIAGWVVMALAILFNLTAQYLTCKLHDWNLRLLDLCYKQNSGQIDPLEMNELSQLEKQLKRNKRAVTRLANLQFYLTGLSIVLLVLFSSVNTVVFAWQLP